jgi:hypothetical protein
MGGWVFIGYIDEHGEEREASYQCRRCADGRWLAALLVVALGSMLAGRYYYGSLAQLAITSGV